MRNKVTLHVTPEESRQAILEAIRSAREAFWIEMFIWQDDEAGREVAQALIDRKRLADRQGEPFDARVMIDWFGLRVITKAPEGASIVDLLRKNGIEVVEFNPKGIDPTAAGASPITHRKLFIQDGTKFLTGGRNIGNQYLRPTYTAGEGKSAHAWHDLMLTVQGDETSRIQRLFLKNWALAGGRLPATIPAAHSASRGEIPVQTVVTDPHERKQQLRDAQLALIRSAKQEIRLSYPYLSDDELIAELRQAKKRNPQLKVQVLIPRKRQKGFQGYLYSKLNLKSARQLMAAGIEVRMLGTRPGGDGRVEAFSHFKALAVDGKVLSLGSANGDARTMLDNHELNVIVHDAALAHDFIQRVLGPDWKHAIPVTTKTLAAVPLRQRLLKKVLEVFDFLF